MRQRVWEAAHVRLRSVTLDTDTTVHTLFGQQMGARKAYNPQHKGKKSYQPLLTFCAERRECLRGELYKYLSRNNFPRINLSGGADSR